MLEKVQVSHRVEAECLDVMAKPFFHYRSSSSSIPCHIRYCQAKHTRLIKSEFRIYGHVYVVAKLFVRPRLIT